MFVHTSPLYSMDHNGPEVVIAIGLLSLALAAAGSGRFGIDHLITRRRRAAADASWSTASPESHH
jgi:putative oxidoreductase